MSEIKLKKVKPNAKLPTRATEGSAGLDLYACIDEPVTLNKGDTVLIPTGIAIGLDDPHYAAFIYARSGLAIKYGLTLLNAVGVIDSDYRGEVCVGLIKLTEEPYTIQPFERIAQMVIKPVELPEILEVEELDNTNRGAGGFGSTGKKEITTAPTSKNTKLEQFILDWAKKHNLDIKETEFWDFYVEIGPDIFTSEIWESQNRPDEEFDTWFNCTATNEMIIEAAKKVLGYTDYNVWCN